jgi:hypothetical protein
MPKKMAPVPAKAIMIRLAPLARPSTARQTRRDSIRPMKKVKASSMGTPAAEFLVFSIANMKPKAPTRNTIRPMPPTSRTHAGLHADPGAQHGGHHRQRQQPVGVAQDAVAFGGQRAATGEARIVLHALIHEPPRLTDPGFESKRGF